MKRKVAATCALITPLVLLAAIVAAGQMNIHVGLLKSLPPPGMDRHEPAEAGRIHIGNLRIIPRLTVQAVHDDNIFLGNGKNESAEKEESDWITHVVPGLLLDYGFGPRGGLKLGYHGDLAYYKDNDRNDWQTHRGLADLDYRSPGGLIVRAINVYTDADDPYSSENEYRLGEQIKRWHNNLKTKVGFEFSDRFRVLAYYNSYKQDYDNREDFTQDYSSTEFGTGFQMNLMPKTWGFVRYHYGEREYDSLQGGVTNDNDADFSWQRVNTGLTWDPGAKLSGELNFGYQWKDYDNRTSKDGFIYDDRDTWVASTFVAYRPALTRVLSLSVLRALREVGSDTDEYYEDTVVGLGFEQLLLDKLTLSVGGIYSENDYNVFQDEERKDDNYKANIGLEYRLQDWVRAGVSYNYWRKDSSIPRYDFTDNRFVATLSFVY
jgi:hypothetical protein